MCFKSKKISDISDDSLEEIKRNIDAEFYNRNEERLSSNTKDYVVVIVIKDNKKREYLITNETYKRIHQAYSTDYYTITYTYFGTILMSSEFIGIENISIPVLAYNIGEVDREQIIALSYKDKDIMFKHHSKGKSFNGKYY